MLQVDSSPELKRNWRDLLLTRFLMPRPWHGMTFPVWWSLLARNGYALSPQKLPLAAAVTVCSAFNSLFGWQERLLYGRRATRTEFSQPPLFVIGHWRAGTTLLHELLAEDRQFTWPTVYQTMAPSHFLSTARLLSPLIDTLMPRQRPMDNVLLDLSRPMEDEFALCNLGLPSPYLSWAWPNQFRCSSYMLLEELNQRELERWKREFVHFLKKLLLSRPGRILLKSPPHTARIRHLIELFPDAQFVHIVRHPYSVFASSIKTWRRMQRLSGLQRPTHRDLEAQVLEVFSTMYERLEQDRFLVPPENFCELRYEDLIEDPLRAIERVYQHLRLGNFQQVADKMQHYMMQRCGYRAASYELPEEMCRRIAACWGSFMEPYGYQLDTSLADPSTNDSWHNALMPTKISSRRQVKNTGGAWDAKATDH